MTTEDGYILNVYRILASPTSDREDAASTKPAVFLMHGVTDSADCWIMHYPKLAPAFRLLRAGYDVWLGNQRGTKYSLGHTTLDYKKDKAYWEFSFTEMGLYDAPAQVDYVRAHTGQAKISYIGHSQGTSQMFYGLSANQTFWEERLNLFAALAPVTRLTHTGSDLFKLAAQMEGTIAEVASALHVWDILGPFCSAGTTALCGALPSLCQMAEGFLITQNPKLDNTARFQVYMGHFPAGASVQSLLHYA